MKYFYILISVGWEYDDSDHGVLYEYCFLLVEVVARSCDKYSILEIKVC